MARLSDRTRDIDHFEVCESIQYLGIGVVRFSSREIGQYVEMVQYVCDKLGWDSSHLRGYRCRVQYPLYNVQYSMSFDLPPAPAGASADQVG